MQTRLAAARVLRSVGEGGSLSRDLPAVLTKIRPEAHATVRALAYGALRYYERIDALLALLLRKPLKRKDRIVADLLRVALFELLDAETPDYAVVDNTVRIVRQQRPWAGGMANAVLRRFLRERGSLLATVMQQPEARYLLPVWLIGKLQKAWPEEFERIAEAMAEPPPMTLRVDLSRTDRESYLKRLEQAGIGADPHPVVASAIVLHAPTDVTALPGFDEGLVSVQDAAAQLAAGLLDVVPGQRILDACAAPGGKTVHILESVAGDAAVTAVESDPARVERLRENIARSGYSAEIVVADAADTAAWWDGKPFDRILLDAPCSATGVIRRHPDIKRHRQPDDITALVEQQRRLLDALWPLLAAGGLMLYATCSVLPEENVRQIEAFLEARADAASVSIDVEGGVAMEVGKQLLPGDAGRDGFFYAGIRKLPDILL